MIASFSHGSNQKSRGTQAEIPLFSSDLVTSVPPMSWLYHMNRNGANHLFHGSSVEVWTEGFFEGCFAGRWLTDDVTQCAEVFGSGLKIKNGVHHFITPSHTLESLFSFAQSDQITLSNSLSFILEFHHLTLPLDLSYGARFASVVLGVDAYQRELARVRGGHVSRIVFDNLRVNCDLSVEHVRKPMAPGFDDYKGYIAYLTRTLESAFSNAGTDVRRVRYAPLATCSTGYDSAASAALARDLGCRTAVTLRTSREDGADSGLAVGRALGMQVHEVERTDRAESFESVADFLSTGMGGEDYCYSRFAGFLNRRLLLTGFHGDKMWDVHAKPNTVLARGDISGNSLQEYRLRLDFIHVPVPMIGARRHTEVTVISRSAEMEPFRIGTDYDRPIPRRVLEERGIPRGSFGQRKKAASLLLFLRPTLIPKPALATKEWPSPSSARIVGHSLAWTSRKLVASGLLRLWRRLQLPGSPAKLLVDEWRTFEHSHPGAVPNFLNALSITRGRYRGVTPFLSQQASQVACEEALAQVNLE